MTIAPRNQTTQTIPLIVPHGKIVDFVDGKLRRDTPEEYVRQEIEKSLVREYKFPKEQIAVEYSIKMGAARKAADVVIFDSATVAQENVKIIVECKSEDVPADDRKEGLDQLKSYLAACVNAEFGMWTNSKERYCLRKHVRSGTISFVDINDIPAFGKTLDEIERPKRADLKRATSDALLFTFRRTHNYIAGNQGLQKPEAFWELLKLIFCRIEDERSDEELIFFATSAERQSMNGQLKVQQRISKLFGWVKSKYSSIFRANEEIELEPRVIAYVVSQLQPYSLLKSDIDVKGKAYEEIVGSNLRGDRGEFFTPRNICRMAVEIAAPSPADLIIDPACGTGGFLITAMNFVLERIDEIEGRKWSKGEPTKAEMRELDRRRSRYVERNVVGMDINPNLVKASKMNMVLNDDGAAGIYQANSLAKPITWRDELRARDLIGIADFVFTNPPFGSKIMVDDPAILAQYDLGHIWDYKPGEGRFLLRNPRTLQKSQPPEILFIERCIQFLKPGSGVLCIVLPDAILGAPGLTYVREWIIQHTQILASIDLHPDTFQPKNSTQTSILVVKRRTAPIFDFDSLATESVFLALADHIGHDKRGNTKYVRDEAGDEVLNELLEHNSDGTTVISYERVVDDDTLDIARMFRNTCPERFGAK